jgi:hypothetical protein
MFSWGSLCFWAMAVYIQRPMAYRFTKAELTELRDYARYYLDQRRVRGEWYTVARAVRAFLELRVAPRNPRKPELYEHDEDLCARGCGRGCSRNTYANGYEAGLRDGANARKRAKQLLEPAVTPPQRPQKPKKHVCYICEKSSPPCDRGIYLAHGNGGAYSGAAAHSKCVKKFGDAVEGWNEEYGWYVRGKTPTLKDVTR